MFQEVPAGAVVQNKHLFKRVVLWKNLGIGNIRENFKDVDWYFIARKEGDHKMSLRSQNGLHDIFLNLDGASK